MAKQNMMQRELKRHMLVKLYKTKRKELLKQFKNAKTLPEIFKIQKFLQRLPGNSLPIRLRNRCWKTGRCRGFYRDFGLSRHVLREMSNKCLLPGIIKSSW